MPLWVVEILPLLCQITKIDSGICFGFCVWFCSWVFGDGSGCLVLFLGIWSWKWERMTSDPLSVLPSHRRRCCQLLWKWLLERRWERGIGIRIGVWFLFCCCFLGLLLREDESVSYCFCFLGLFHVEKFSPQLCQHMELESVRHKLQLLQWTRVFQTC